ncbi:DEAD/DEAH box helicase [candidate division KSB1 bacterium]|nr:DEAD/DEAH box helicase [candidate division KSB1 bacterium]
MKSDHYQAWNQGAKNNLAVLPTGGGKSVLVTDIVLDQVRLGRPGVVKAHRNELISQMSLHVARRQIPHRIIGPDTMIRSIIAQHREEFAGRSYVQQDAITTVAGVDTINARKDSLTEWALQQDYWITDEAHHLLRANKWGKSVEIMPNAFGLGVTATPERADGKGLGAHADGVFQHMTLGPQMRELIDMCFLTDYEIAAPEASFVMTDDDLTPSNEFSNDKMITKARNSQIVGDVVLNYCKFAFGKRAICFATDVETAEKISKSFNAAGIPAAAVSGKTHESVRNEAIRRFRDGRLTVLVNVDLFGEGFDVPACEVVIMARPTNSLSVYLQQFGRALRTFKGKLFGLVIDHVENWKRHGFPDQPRFWTLDAREKSRKKEKDPEEMPLKRCLNKGDPLNDVPPCGKPYLAFLTKCPFCGFKPEPAGRAAPEQVEGDLMLLDREKLEELRRQIELESPASVAQRQAAAAGFANAGAAAMERQTEKHHAQARLREVIEQWAGIQRFKGRDDRESYRRFYYAAGMDVLSALSNLRSRVDYEKTTEQVERWIHDAIN